MLSYYLAWRWREAHVSRFLVKVGFCFHDRYFPTLVFVNRVKFLHRKVLVSRMQEAEEKHCLTDVNSSSLFFDTWAYVLTGALCYARWAWCLLLVGRGHYMGVESCTFFISAFWLSDNLLTSDSLTSVTINSYTWFCVSRECQWGRWVKVDWSPTEVNSCTTPSDPFSPVTRREIEQKVISGTWACWFGAMLMECVKVFAV